MGKLRDLVDDLYPEGATAEERVRFLRLLFRAGVVFHIAWACGLLVQFGLPGFVKANEVDEKVKTAVEPFRTELGKVITKQEEMSDRMENQDVVLKLIRVDLLESKLREFHILKCKVSFADTRQLDAEIQAAQRQHKELTGDRYELPPCRSVP